MLFQKMGKIFFVITTLMVLVLGTADWMRGKNAFFVKDVQVEGNCLLTQENLIKSAQIDSSKDLFQLQPTEIAARLKQKNPMLRQVDVERQFPGAIRINVKEAKPIAVIHFQDRIMGIDTEGALLTNIAPSVFYDLPIITGIQLEKLPVRGFVFSEGFDSVISFIKECKKHHLFLYNQISEVQFNSQSGMVFYLMGSALPVVLGRQRISEKINNFNIAYPRLVHDSVLEQAKYIDMRMESQIIVSL